MASTAKRYDLPRPLVLLVVLSMSLSCERNINLGSLEGSASEGNGGAASNGGAQSIEGLGGDPEIPPETEPALPDQLIFASDFESADLSEWGESGTSLVSPGGSVTVNDAQSSSGSYSLLVTTAQTNEHVILSTQTDAEEILISFWLFVAQTYETTNWVFLHLDSELETTTSELWDLGLAVDGSDYGLFLWEKLSFPGEIGEERARATTSFQAGSWQHIELHLLSAQDATGFIRVYQGENLVISAEDIVTGIDLPLRLSFGSYSAGLEPRPAELWFDDFTIYAR